MIKEATKSLHADYLCHFPAPAKLNLFLRILGRDESSYHQLQTVFQFLDYCDTLYFRFRDDEKIEVSPLIDNLLPQQNLVWKAADLLRKRAQQDGIAGSQRGVDIFVEKKLPIGGGVGGGSSNAACCLLVLNQLWQCHYDQQTLAEMALSLGADVPVFVAGFSAWAEGRGERLQAIEIAEPWYLVIQPNCHVSTAEIFRHRELTRDSSPITIRAFLSGTPFESHLELQADSRLRDVSGATNGLKNPGVSALVKSYLQVGNDCEALVKKLYPEVAQALNALNEVAQGQLTGTGACVFAAFESRQEAEAALVRLQEKLNGSLQNEGQAILAFKQVFIAKACNRSPLQQALAEYF